MQIGTKENAILAAHEFDEKYARYFLYPKYSRKRCVAIFSFYVYVHE